MKVTFDKAEKDALLRACVLAGFTYQIHELANNDLQLNAYVMDHAHKELTLPQAFWLGSMFRGEVQVDLRKEVYGRL